MNFETFIEQNRTHFTSIFNPELTSANTIYMDLSTSNNQFEGLGEAEQDAAILKQLGDAGALAGVGGYLENRSMYRETELFQDDQERSIHIGVDVFIADGVAIHAPLDGEIHSFANRKVIGDYGPVIILKHQLQGVEFHTLYGHLNEACLRELSEGKTISQGEKIGRIGARIVNGNWPPHLHFQIVLDMQGKQGDYPGVVRPHELEMYKQNCPDPSALLVG